VPFLHNREYKLAKISGSILPKNLPLEAEKDDDEDIERLTYTAFTRAKDSLTLTYSPLSSDERANEALAHIATENDDWEEVNNIEASELADALEEEKKDLYSLPYLGEEQDFLRDRIEKNFVMNATALQNFLDITNT
jgi:ATP-dependent exoDNAse (exonuclease V) beta subunit